MYGELSEAFVTDRRLGPRSITAMSSGTAFGTNGVARGDNPIFNAATGVNAFANGLNPMLDNKGENSGAEGFKPAGDAEELKLGENSGALQFSFTLKLFGLPAWYR